MTKVEKLREEIDDTLEDTANSLSPSRHKDFIGLDDVLDSLIAAAKEEEREKIRNGSKYDDYHDDERWCGRPDGDPAKAFWTVPASLLSPAPTEPEVKP